MEHTLSNDSSTSNAPKEVPVLYGPSSLRQLPAKMIQPKLKKSTLKLGKGGAVPGSLRDNEILRPLSRGTPTDDTRLARNLAETPRQRELARQRTQYFNEAFGLREPYHSSQQRVRQVSIVVVEVKTNIQVEDALAAISDMTFNFAQIFQRPESSMMLILDDNALLRFGSTNDPAYLMTISALPQMIAPIMNLRHTALVQSAMEEILQIPKHRGVIRFESMLEENFATNGATIKDEIEQMNRSSHEDHNNLFRTISRTMTRRSKASVTTNATRTVAPNISRRTPVERISTGDDIPEASISKGSLAETEKEKRIKKYRSIAKLFSH